MKHSLIRFDWQLLLPVFVLLALSLATLASINVTYFEGQLFAIIVGLFFYIFFSQMNIITMVRMTRPIYFLALLLLSIVLIIGFESRGAVRWIDVFGISVQFSEILKPLLALSLAGYLSRNEDRNLRSYIFTILLIMPIVFLIAFQPDLGTALIYLAVVLIVLFIYGYPLLWFILSALPVVIASPILWTFLHDYQRQRILTFMNPTADPQGTSYNAVQAIIAVGSGMFLGKGMQESTQSHLRFLPERQTDFIFATLSEGLGFIGGVIILVSIGVLLYRIYRIYQTADNTYAQIYASCVFMLLLIQFFVNIGMNIGIVPIVGVTLPFVSYGGSSIVSNFILLGLLTSLDSQTRRRNVLEIK